MGKDMDAIGELEKANLFFFFFFFFFCTIVYCYLYNTVLGSKPVVHCIEDPAPVVSHIGVYPCIPWLGTANPPADQPSELPARIPSEDYWPTAITLTGVLLAILRISGAEISRKKCCRSSSPVYMCCCLCKGLSHNLEFSVRGRSFRGCPIPQQSGRFFCSDSNGSEVYFHPASVLYSGVCCLRLKGLLSLMIAISFFKLLGSKPQCMKILSACIISSDPSLKLLSWSPMETKIDCAVLSSTQ